jgi:hypothetical protein
VSTSLEPIGRTSPLTTIAWGAFLGVSWTWCIGMFLPVLLMRDYGHAAWWAFALPNVLGAAAMAWALSRQGHSEQLSAAHRFACAAFSVVTIAFHLLFLALVVELAPWPTLLAVVVAFVVIVLLGAVRRNLDLLTAILVWLVSVALLVVIFRNRGQADAGGGALALRELAHLAPVMIFGFLLCPYLDLTFHRARQALAPGPSKVAFAVGFGGFFLAMIAGTYFYAPTMMNLLAGDTATLVGTTLAAAIALHAGVQTAFTLWVHGRAVRRFSRWGLLPLLLAALVVGAMYPLFGQNTTDEGMSLFEASYRLFMAFYGLIFPAYVWLCMTPTWRAPASPTRRMVLVWLVAIAVASPMFWKGFIDRQTIWLLPGVALVLLARLAVGKPQEKVGWRTTNERSNTPASPAS